MSNYNTELSDFEMEIDKTLENISEHHQTLQSPQVEEKKFQHNQSVQAQNNIVFHTESLHLNDHSQLKNYNGEDLKNVGDTEGSDEYFELELHKYLNSTVEPSPRKEYVENRRNQSLDEFFQDFYEIISSEMKPSTYAQTNTTMEPTDVLAFDDQTRNFNSTDSGVDFNMDLTQFYVDTPHESDLMNTMLQSPDLRTDYASHIQPQYVAASSLNENKFLDNHSELAMVQHSNEQYLHVNTNPSQHSQLNQFYVNLNGDVTNASNEDNSMVTYINKDTVQSLEYITESGQTETVMYVNQLSDSQHQVKNAVDITQYEIIDFDAYRNTENIDSTMHSYHIDSSAIENNIPNEQVTFLDESHDVSLQPDLLSSLLSDKNNKIIIIAKPLRNPKIKHFNDEFYSKFNETMPSSIPFSKRPTIKGNQRKQKLELKVDLNQIDFTLTKPTEKRGRPCKINKTMVPMTTFLPETPKLPSAFVRDRKKHNQVRRKRPRKLIWDSESDCDSMENCNDTLNEKKN